MVDIVILTAQIPGSLDRGFPYVGRISFSGIGAVVPSILAAIVPHVFNAGKVS